MQVYLDSSAIVKRYVSEKGTDVLNLIYTRLESADVFVATSIWNIGEVLGVLDAYKRRGWIDETQFRLAIHNFAGETTRLARLKIFKISGITY